MTFTLFDLRHFLKAVLAGGAAPSNSLS